MTEEEERYEKIIGGTATDAEERFPWLADAKFKDAVIDISGDKLQWVDGLWKNGTWKDGTWVRGTWKDGIWEGRSFIRTRFSW